MKAMYLFVSAAVCLGAAAGVGKANEPPLAFGAVFDGRAFVVADDAAILQMDLRDEEADGKRIDFFRTAARDDFPPRWKIAFRSLVMTHSDAGGGARTGIRTRDINTVGLSLVDDPTEAYFPGTLNDPWRDAGWNNNLIAYLYESMRGYVNDRDRVFDDQYPFSHYEFFFDLVPEKPGVCRYFVLASESLQTAIEETRRRNDGKPTLRDQTQVAPVECDIPWHLAKDPLKPMLGVWLKDKRGQWALVDKIKDPCFNERFHVFVQGDDWYFVTDSGKVFLSRKPDKDGDRKLVAVWDDAKRPIVAAVTDADTGKTFLFGRPVDKDAKPFYFEPAEKPKPTEFDADAIKPPGSAAELKSPEPLKTVTAYAHFLIAEKQIKLPDKTDKEKEK